MCLKSAVLRKISLLILLFLFLPGILFAQKGKISGKVTDARTGEELIGVNILVVGTNIGAASDVSGRYSIINVTPGIVEISASLLGYGKVTVSDVEVFVDRTTTVNIKLSEETIQIEQVVVKAEKPKIIKDQTSTSSSLSEAQIKTAPVEGLRGQLDLNAGFQKTATGNYTVRGSGSYEVNFQVNGVEQVNTSTGGPAGTPGTEKADNSWKYDVNPLGVSQMQLITGGFSAEYGNAQAGVVKVVLKEGTPKLSGEFRVEYRPAGQYHFGEYLYDQNNYEWTKWGNFDNWWAKRNEESFIREIGILDKVGSNDRYNWLYDRLKSGGATASDSAAWNEVLDREIRWAHGLWVKNHSPADDNPLGVYDYRQQAYTRYLIGFGGPLGKEMNSLKFYFSGEYRKNPTRLPTPERNLVYQNYILNLTYTPIRDHKFKLMTSYQNYTGGIWSGSDDIRWAGIAFVPSGSSTKYLVTVDPVRTEQTVSQSFNYVYTISNSSFLEATLTNQNDSYTLPYKYLVGNTQEVDRLDSLGDTRGAVLRDGSWYESALFRRPFNLSTNYYQDSRNNILNFSFDYTNQISQAHLLKTGIRFAYYDLFNHAVNSSFTANTYLIRSGYAEYYQAYPINAAFYIQDKMEFEGMVANLGLRGDIYNFQEEVPADRFNIFYQGKGGPGKPDQPYGNPETVPSETKFILMPRIGVSFPIGENTAFRIQYGHFASMPIFTQALSQRTDQGWLVRGNPNLDFKKSINFEFGLQQILDDAQRLDAVLYYNDRVSQIGTQRYASFTGSLGPQGGVRGYTTDDIPLYPYTTYDNNAFGASVGVEFSIEKINVENWRYKVSYSLSQTTDGNYGSEFIYPDNTRAEQRNFTGEFLSSSDRTHSLRAIVQYVLRNEEGLRMFGFKPFQNSTFSLTYSAQSGLPFTYITTFDLSDIRNNRRYPLESVFDFSFNKDIYFGGTRILLGMRVMNLFNNRWLTPLSGTDLNFWVEKGITMDNPADKSEIELTSYRIAAFKTYKNIPRQVFFSLGIGF
ncbi:MAG: hypothetical protein FMNOHCHN_00828 [Ignavibacteriaceae bacterium]|nr:hypothetical protein [Ignavibacteriaceae bacterium]